MFKKLLVAMLSLFAAMAFAAVDANKATQTELEAVKGVGPGIATKILDERKKTPFKDWADMVERVRGIGDANAAKFSAAGLTVNGAGFKGAAVPAAAAKNDDKPAAKVGEKKAAAVAPAPAPAATPVVKADDKKAAAPAAAPASAVAVAAAAAAAKTDDKKSAKAAEAKASDAKK